MFNQLETVTLAAFLVALADLDAPLPQGLQEEINKVGKLLLEQPKAAIDRLVELAKHHCISELYWQARSNIQKQYETQEKNKYRDLDKESEANNNDADMIENLSIALPSKSITEIGQPILKAADSRAAAKQNEVEIRLVIRRAI
ncbi:hypothetical protein H6G04_20660 [Calothrix membranacea FACHB-236]|nr:hypothetical protein [Calothrix membranacea FACHB-236]